MNRADLIAAFRTRADDVTEPYLWSDEEIALYLSESENEAAVRARLIKDSTSTEAAVIAVVANTVDYALHASVFEILRVKLDSQRNTLPRTTVDELDSAAPGWEGRTGSPKYYIEEEGRIRLVPTPLMNDTLRLTVHRLPLESLKGDGSTPEIHAKYHYRLIDWALRCAYMKPDSETLDKVKSGEYAELFRQSFGERPDANVERKQRDHAPTVVKMIW